MYICEQMYVEEEVKKQWKIFVKKSSRKIKKEASVLQIE